MCGHRFVVKCICICSEKKLRLSTEMHTNSQRAEGRGQTDGRIEWTEWPGRMWAVNWRGYLIAICLLNYLHCDTAA